MALAMRPGCCCEGGCCIPVTIRANCDSVLIEVLDGSSNVVYSADVTEFTLGSLCDDWEGCIPLDPETGTVTVRFTGSFLDDGGVTRTAVMEKESVPSGEGGSCSWTPVIAGFCLICSTIFECGPLDTVDVTATVDGAGQWTGTTDDSGNVCLLIPMTAESGGLPATGDITVTTPGSFVDVDSTTNCFISIGDIWEPLEDCGCLCLDDCEERGNGYLSHRYKITTMYGDREFTFEGSCLSGDLVFNVTETGLACGSGWCCSVQFVPIGPPASVTVQFIYTVEYLTTHWLVTKRVRYVFWHTGGGPTFPGSPCPRQGVTWWGGGITCSSFLISVQNSGDYECGTESWDVALPNAADLVDNTSLTCGTPPPPRVYAFPTLAETVTIERLPCGG